MGLFVPERSPVVEALAGIDPDELTPKQALEALYRLKNLGQLCLSNAIATALVVGCIASAAAIAGTTNPNAEYRPTARADKAVATP